MKTKSQNKEVGNCPCDLAGYCSERTDTEIIEFVKKNKECYALLVERYEDKLTRYVRRISGATVESVEDILQNVFLKVYVNLNAFDPEMEFSSWIYRITHNETINYWRKHKKKNELVVSLDANEHLKNVLGDKCDTEKQVIGKINAEQMFAALAKMDRKYKDVLTLNYVNGRSYREIAREIDSPIGTVGTLINRGKRILREELEKIGLNSKALAR